MSKEEMKNMKERKQVKWKVNMKGVDTNEKKAMKKHKK